MSWPRAWADFRDDPDLRVAILSGNEAAASVPAPTCRGEQPRQLPLPGQSIPDITQTQGVYKPIVAALHSHVIGYGMWIAMDADIRIATRRRELLAPRTAVGHRHHSRWLVPQARALGDRL